MANNRLRVAAKSALFAAFFFSTITPLSANGISGPYLAARQATLSSDYSEAAKYYLEAMRARPGNLLLKESAALSLIASGEMERAAEVARAHKEAGGSNQIIDLILVTQAVGSGNFDAAVEGQDNSTGLGRLITGLIGGWARLGQGNMSEAIEAFEELGSNSEFASFAHYHHALALASVGDFEASHRIFSGEAFGPLSLSSRGIVAHAQVLAQLERPADAIELLTAANSSGLRPEFDDLLKRLQAGEPQEFDVITEAAHGVAEVFFNLGSALASQASADHVLLYMRLAQFLRPDHAPALLTIADLLEQLRQYDLAATAYASVPRDDPAHYIAEMGRADVLYASDRQDAAAEVLTTLARTSSDIPIVHAALGDLLSRLQRNEESIEAYTRSIELRGENDPSAWGVFYARGIVHERLDDFQSMERDFRKALELSPNHPDVLNYLGYSLVEQRTKLDEALDMIITAVEKRPESGYITDSLGWVYYRLGRFDEAVAPMERAVELVPVDPIINDHLGDVYWMVGREREAEFQWKRALSFDPEEEEAARIRRKLEVGLDVVLKEEEADDGVTQTAND